MKNLKIIVDSSQDGVQSKIDTFLKENPEIVIVDIKLQTAKTNTSFGQNITVLIGYI